MSINSLFLTKCLSFLLATAKIKYAKPRAKNREIHMLLFNENWLTGTADLALQAWRGHGFHTGPHRCVDIMHRISDIARDQLGKFGALQNLP